MLLRKWDIKMSKWQDNGSWKEWFEITGADGVDFHMVGCHPEKGDPIYPGESYTKEEFFKAKSYPRSDYTFWKLVNGEKYYISLTQPKKKDHKVSITVNLEYVVGYLRYGHKEGTIKLTDNEFKEFEQNPYNFISKYDVLDKLEFVLDDYEVDSYGPIESIDWEEVK